MSATKLIHRGMVLAAEGRRVIERDWLGEYSDISITTRSGPWTR